MLLAMCLSSMLRAQDRMAVAPLFKGRLADVQVLSETHVEGEQLKKYMLTVFHSVQCRTSVTGFRQVEQLLARDEQKATEKEVQRRNQTTSFALLRYKQTNGTNHYIIYKRRGQTDFVCVYLEGNASVEQLKNIFYK